MNSSATGTQLDQEEEAAPSSRQGTALTLANVECLKETYRLLAEFQLASSKELAELAELGQQPPGKERQVDPLEILVKCRGVEPDDRPVEIERMGRLIGTALQKPMVLPPFASRLPSPSAFYDGNPGLLEECQSLMTPVLYAEEAEVIGIGSINPVAMAQATDRIVAILGERTGTKPIVSSLLLTHEGWLGMCHKQLGI
jgi:hypothetical protein